MTAGKTTREVLNQRRRRNQNIGAFLLLVALGLLVANYWVKSIMIGFIVTWLGAGVVLYTTFVDEGLE